MSSSNWTEAAKTIQHCDREQSLLRISCQLYQVALSALICTGESERIQEQNGSVKGCVHCAALHERSKNAKGITTKHICAKAELQCLGVSADYNKMEPASTCQALASFAHDSFGSVYISRQHCGKQLCPGTI